MQNSQVKKFSADVGKVLHLMINSIYTNKDIFLRELISNASDACDKLRVEGLQNPGLTDQTPLRISVLINKQAHSITVKDSGIGMTAEELETNLGVIAQSGTQKFLTNLSDGERSASNLIGQFGVGFYSAFMVGKTVCVRSRRAGSEQVWQWQSDGIDGFSIERLEDDSMGHGTEIVISLKDDEYLDKYRLRHIIETYSEHITLPIELVEDGDEAEIVGGATALWLKPRSEVTQQEYKNFYSTVSHDGGDYAMVMHNMNEGVVNYTNLLFVPARRSHDLFHPDRKTRVRLYIKRVFINDDVIDVIPRYLRFLRGVIDSSDLPLNISRETLQHNPVLDKIRSSVTKRVLTELGKHMREDRGSYQKIWENFGAVMKEGLCEPFQANVDILDICLFKHINDDGAITLSDYVNSMRPNQSEIYYVSADEELKARSHPQLEAFKSKGIDVLIFTDAVDDFWINVIGQYKQSSFKSVAASDLDLSKIESPHDQDADEEVTDSESEYSISGVIAFCKLVLGNLVKEVRESKRLTTSAACLAIESGSMDPRFERVFRDQGGHMDPIPRIMEVNPKHPLVRFISRALTDKALDSQAKAIVHLLFEEACLMQGIPLKDPASFINRVNQMVGDAVTN